MEETRIQRIYQGGYVILFNRGSDGIFGARGYISIKSTIYLKGCFLSAYGVRLSDSYEGYIINFKIWKIPNLEINRLRELYLFLDRPLEEDYADIQLIPQTIIFNN